MTEPKPIRVAKAFHERLKTIDGTGSFFNTLETSNLFRGKLELDGRFGPVCSVFLNARVLNSEIGERGTYPQSIVIEMHNNIDNRDAEDVAWEMIADIQRAIETSDRTVGNLVLNGIKCLREEMFYPPNNSGTVSVQVEYDITTVRRYGNPVN